MEHGSCPIAISLRGHCPVKWLSQPSVGRLRGIIVVGDPHTLELIDSKVGYFSVCRKFKSLDDNFVWGLMFMDDDNLCSIFSGGVRTFILFGIFLGV